MGNQKTKQQKVPENQQELLREYKEAFKRMPVKTLKTILQLRAEFEEKGMAI